MGCLPEVAIDSVVINIKEEDIITVEDSNLVLRDIEEDDKIKEEFTLDTKGKTSKLKQN